MPWIPGNISLQRSNCESEHERERNALLGSSGAMSTSWYRSFVYVLTSSFRTHPLSIRTSRTTSSCLNSGDGLGGCWSPIASSQRFRAGPSTFRGGPSRCRAGEIRCRAEAGFLLEWTSRACWNFSRQLRRRVLFLQGRRRDTLSPLAGVPDFLDRYWRFNVPFLKFTFFSLILSRARRSFAGGDFVLRLAMVPFSELQAWGKASNVHRTCVIT